MKGAVLNFAFLFGLGVLALLILLLAGFFARGKVVVILAGVVATVLMVLECLLLNLLAGIGSATSTSQQGYRMLEITAAVFVLSLAAYFPLALVRVKRRCNSRGRWAKEPEANSLLKCAVKRRGTPVGEKQTHPATYAPAGSSRGGQGCNELSEALGAKGPLRWRVSEQAGRNANEHRASPETM